MSALTRPIQISSASLADLEELLRVHRSAALQNPADRDALIDHPEVFGVPPEQIISGNVFCARLDGNVLGFASLELREDGDSELDALFVDPHVWRHGIATQLVNHCLQLAASRGSKRVWVVGNPAAAEFYKALGFINSGSTQTQFGPALLLQKSIAGAV